MQSCTPHKLQWKPVSQQEKHHHQAFLFVLPVIFPSLNWLPNTFQLTLATNSTLPFLGSWQTELGGKRQSGVGGWGGGVGRH